MDVRTNQVQKLRVPMICAQSVGISGVAASQPPHMCQAVGGARVRGQDYSPILAFRFRWGVGQERETHKLSLSPTFFINGVIDLLCLPFPKALQICQNGEGTPIGSF